MPLQEKLDKKQFVVTIEVQPAVDDGMFQLLKEINCIKGRVDCLNITEIKKHSEDDD